MEPEWGARLASILGELGFKVSSGWRTYLSLSGRRVREFRVTGYAVNAKVTVVGSSRPSRVFIILHGAEGWLAEELEDAGLSVDYDEGRLSASASVEGVNDVERILRAAFG